MIQSGELIYNEIEQGLINISGDLVISHESQGPMKMQGKEVTAGKTWSLKLKG